MVSYKHVNSLSSLARFVVQPVFEIELVQLVAFAFVYLQYVSGSNESRFFVFSLYLINSFANTHAQCIAFLNLSFFRLLLSSIFFCSHLVFCPFLVSCSFLCVGVFVSVYGMNVCLGVFDHQSLFAPMTS